MPNDDLAQLYFWREFTATVVIFPVRDKIRHQIVPCKHDVPANLCRMPKSELLLFRDRVFFNLFDVLTLIQ